MTKVIKMPRFLDLYPKQAPLYFKIIEIRGDKIAYELYIVGQILKRNQIEDHITAEILMTVIHEGTQKIEAHLPLPSNKTSVKFISNLLNEILQENLKIFDLTGLKITDEGFLICEDSNAI